MRRNLFFCVFLLFQLCVASASAVTKKEAQTLIETRRWTQAVEALQALMQQSAYAKDADCNKWLGQALCLTGHYSESLPYLEFAVKKNQRSGAQWYLSITRQHLYDFDGALEALEAYRPVLNSDFWLSRADSLEAEIQQGLRAMDHIEDVVVVDSLLLPRDAFFASYKLGAESGRVLQGDDGLFFENQGADYRIYAIHDELFQSHRIQGVWEDLDPLPGLGSEDFHVIDPFMRSDGETLYFACDSTPGLGGLDIYKTKYNAEEDVYYQPERLGMPFNSPFDDYMLAIDETHQVGWWATERKQYPDHVVVYIFKLNDDPEYLDEASVGRARIDNIRDTWQEDENYTELIASLMNAEQQVTEQLRMHIVINDSKVYTQEEQFVMPEALAAYRQSVKLREELDSTVSQLSSLRAEYVTASEVRRGQLRAQILRLEQRQIDLAEQCRAQVKLYRRLEQ